jgi:hypothetical protein
LSVYFCLADRFFNSFSCFWLDLFWECWMWLKKSILMESIDTVFIVY